MTYPVALPLSARETAARWIPALLVLLPYATTRLGFRQALYVQTAGILLLLGGLALLRRAASWPAALASLSVPARIGLALYLGATGLGTVVAFVRGNDPLYLAGQVLSMVLLPLAAVAFAGLGIERPWSRFGQGLVAGVAIAVVIHLLHWGYALHEGRFVQRLYLNNGVSVVGPSLMALVLAFYWLASGRKGPRILAALAIALGLLYVLGSGVRGLWIVVPPTLLVATFLVWRQRRRRFSLRTSIAVAATLVVASAGIWGLHHHLYKTRPSLVPAGTFPRADLPRFATAVRSDGSPGLEVRWQGAASLQDLTLTRPIPIQPGAAHRFTATIEGRGTGRCLLLLDWLDRQRQRLGAARPDVIPGTTERRRFSTVGVPRPGATLARLRFACTGDSQGVWTITAPTLERVAPRSLALLEANLAYLRRRAQSIGRVVEGGPIRHHRNVWARATETTTLLTAFRSAPIDAQLFGHGLGATYSRAAFPSTDEPDGKTLSYIHNYYVFLLYKLGILGTVLVMGALVLWAGAARRRGSDDGALFGQLALLLWIAYAIWNLSSPMFLDFRMAPLWGILIAVTTHERETV